MQMSNLMDILDLALARMQGCSRDLMALCEQFLLPAKVLTLEDVKQLRAKIELLAEGIDQDSLMCQEGVDKINNADKINKADNMEVEETGEPLGITMPASPREDEHMCVQEHIE